MQLCSKPRGARGIETFGARDLPKKGSGFITSSDHWTVFLVIPTLRQMWSHPTCASQWAALAERIWW